MSLFGDLWAKVPWATLWKKAKEEVKDPENQEKIKEKAKELINKHKEKDND